MSDIKSEFERAFEDNSPSWKFGDDYEIARWAALWMAQYLAGQLESLPRANDRIRQLAKDLA